MSDTKQTEQQFYPCIENPRTGRISVQVSKQPMSHDEATELLRRHYRQKWLRCEAIPQPVNHPYFTGVK